MGTRAWILQLDGLTLQLQSAKQLRVRGHDDGRSAHCDCAHTHGQIESPAHEKTRCDRYGYKIISGRPNQILDHLSVRSARQLNCPDNDARITTYEYDSSGLNRHISSRTDGDSHVCGCQSGCIVNAITYQDRKSTRLNSSHGYISYAVFCLKKKKNQ